MFTCERAVRRSLNRSMRRIVSDIVEYGSIKFRPSNDIEGDVGYTATLIASDKQTADRIGESLASEGVPYKMFSEIGV